MLLLSLFCQLSSSWKEVPGKTDFTRWPIDVWISKEETRTRRLLNSWMRGVVVSANDDVKMRKIWQVLVHGKRRKACKLKVGRKKKDQGWLRKKAKRKRVSSHFALIMNRRKGTSQGCNFLKIPKTCWFAILLGKYRCQLNKIRQNHAMSGYSS